MKLKYLLQLPKDYNSNKSKNYPLILFLHGAGEKGNNLKFLMRHGIPKIAEENEDFPFIAVSPQCPVSSNWNELTNELDELFNEILLNNRIDLNRIYLTGISMGGFGTWDYATKHPDRFAAIVPICGGGNPALAIRIKDIPIWVFHGANDNIVPINYSEEMVKKLEEFNSKVKFTVYPDAGHDSWTETYNNPNLYKWMLSHERNHFKG